VGECLTESVREFQRRGADREKARLPYLTRRKGFMTSRFLLLDSKSRLGTRGVRREER